MTSGDPKYLSSNNFENVGVVLMTKMGGGAKSPTPKSPTPKSPTPESPTPESPTPKSPKLQNRPLQNRPNSKNVHSIEKKNHPHFQLFDISMAWPGQGWINPAHADP